MELRSVEELMDLLYACRHQRALRTAALLRRSRPADKELQVAGLVHDIGQLLGPAEETARADRAAQAVRPLLGERVHHLVRHHGPTTDEDLLRLREAVEESGSAGFDAGVLEDWRAVLELVAARNSRLETVD
ncbi:hypothetical protein ACI2L1_10090 [Streptomyces sp. NPDC019531]|uniref:hypothetical protein n=1 Tax=Streptomyces sp. NPDC019531 TaxID=3365062 RepID=UPI00384F9B64